MEYINRFGEQKRRDDSLQFQFNIGDIVVKDGVIHIITGFGIYDNQYWTEKIYEDGCRLAAGDYEILKDARTIHGNERSDAIGEYIKSLRENSLRFPCFEKETEAHIDCFVNLMPDLIKRKEYRNLCYNFEYKQGSKISHCAKKGVCDEDCEYMKNFKG